MSTWEDRMSQRAKARMVIAEAEEITRQAVEPEEPWRCIVCGSPPSGVHPLGEGGPWCIAHNPHALVWDERSQTFMPPSQE